MRRLQRFPTTIEYVVRFPLTGYVEVKVSVVAGDEQEARKSKAAAKRQAMPRAKALVEAFVARVTKAAERDIEDYNVACPNRRDIEITEVGRG